ncbi:hypothetical protein LTR91_016357 [Friedmanniomyces endolithicus]|uniref:P-loop containing nucleoside triphosphate hydrolase protein n=1 Tax=Friedmanniomyces endolithicus TaxID=329885 RepID=A0AAN6K822_9PEZI|nr:hypothetical protein LTR94_000271 [Friedmanniomyces endolithicus]KAK0814949.1 hypothetical protein LTR59_000704 [Friedmanniomyces endolithicus]KAK0815218.1 hypothetical protein LTR38_002512 [Friedmanniomyces endolithicus]KAK0855670.1 hypothetical protein LTR03_001770 [Friedmanniomyces endolithicus]KAK0876029.1 hypothetical protein LTR87_010182 [Friedmanniomyces endolithicus]
MATPADFALLSNWALMLNPDLRINRRHSSRTVPLEILSLGLCRTGTLSMQAALTLLNYPSPYHYSSIFANVQDADMWNAALRAKYFGRGREFGRREWDQLLGHCGAVTDVPAVLFWQELVAAYPDAKVVLVVREEEAWFRSCCALLDGALDPFGLYVLRYTDPLWFGRIITCASLYIEGLFGSTNPVVAKANARAAYRKHNAEIRATVPKERLLEYKLGSGWEPLCAFLGKEVPDAPFPNLNDSETLRLSFVYAVAKTIRHSLMNLAVVVGAGAVVGGLVWRYQ